MSENQVQTTQQTEQEKSAVWGRMGVAIWKSELSLQATTQAIIAKLGTAPKEPKDLPAAEERLKIAKQEAAAQSESRLTVTKKLDAVISRMIKPEKDTQAAITEFTQEVIKVKKKKAEDDRLEEQKKEELKQITIKVKSYIANTNAAYLKEQNELLAVSYTHALEKVAPEALPAYLQKVKARITVAKRTMPPPVFAPVYNTKEDIEAHIVSVFNPMSAQEYVDGFAADVDFKYSDYELAWNNKEQAAEINKETAAEISLAIDQQQNIDVAVAGFQGMSVGSPNVSVDTKPLKEEYKISMDETLASAKIIISAYMANAQKCDPNLGRVTKWLDGFGVKQMISALEKVKNNDNAFEFTGLKWKTVEKL